MTDAGWVKLYRKFLEWEWFEKPEMVQLYIYLLIKANHEDKKWRGNVIKRGQLITSLESLKAATKQSIRTIRTGLARLQKSGEIDKQSDTRFTLIKLLKYNDYNKAQTQSDKQNDKRATNERQTSDNNEELRELKELKNNKKRGENRKRFIPPTLEEIKKHVFEKNLTVDPEKFIAFYESKNWMVGKNKMKSWRAALQTWELRNRDKTSKNEMTKFVYAMQDFVAEGV